MHTYISMWKLSHLHVWHCIVLRGELWKSNNNTIFVVVDPNNICMYILPILEFIYKTTDNSNNMRLHNIWMKFKLAHIHKQTHIYSHAFNQSLNHLIKVLFNPLQRWVRFLTIWTYIHIYVYTYLHGCTRSKDCLNGRRPSAWTSSSQHNIFYINT